MRARWMMVCCLPWLGCGHTGSGTGSASKPDGGAADAAPSDADPGSDAASGDAGLGPVDAAAEPDSAPSSGAVGAAMMAASSDEACKSIAPFYWEIGDAHGVLTAASVADANGNATYTDSSSIEIASASKWIFGAYIVERFRDHFDQIDAKAMTMRSGYTTFDDVKCALARPATVQGCFDAASQSQSMPDPATLDSFDYSGGHFQKYAIDLGLGALDDTQLAAEVGRLLGPDLSIGYAVPQLAGGVQMTPKDYGAFLRKILNGQLEIAHHLGEGAVCTLPPNRGGGDCKATYSPATPRAWHYAYGHWVEDDPKQNDDGAFSSPGKFGFYPWIDATKTYYGLVARKDRSVGAYLASAVCGKAIRRAFLAALPQK